MLSSFNWSENSRAGHPPSFGREYLTTEEAADLLGLRPQTLRKAYSSNGRYFSVVPKKAANRRLYWNADLIRALIEGA
ncbi:DNA-binding protein [Burkholderia pseudomallei]|nr:DNA-binding protein [Burkholderia pseudomallei]